ATRRARLVTLLVAGLLCIACDAGQRAAPREAGGDHQAAPTTSAACAGLRARAAIAECPPADLRLDRPTVSHDDAVADRDAAHMAEGVARSYALSNWAVNRGDAAFLRAGLI